MMDIFIELTATIMQNFLIIWFISGYCGYKYNGIKRYISFGIILLADCVFVSIINKFISYDGVLSAISILMYIMSYMFEKRLVFSYIYILFCYGRNIHVIKCYFFLNIELDK